MTSTGTIVFGGVPAACGAATSTNTDSVSVSGAPGSSERLVIDLGQHPFGPGAAVEPTTPEIEIEAALGDEADIVAVEGTPNADTFAAGQLGLALNSDGDADVTLPPPKPRVEFYGFAGNDSITGRGTLGTGTGLQPYPGPMLIEGGDGDDPVLRGGAGNDVIRGGLGNDGLDGQDGNDTLDGGPGDDAISGGNGNDTLVGGPGHDTLNGSAGNDMISADDGEADPQINGGPGNDAAYYDFGLDATPVAVESRHSACTFNPIQRKVTASIAPGGQATLKVTSAGVITFGFTPIPCGTATSTNTDSIVVTGVAGSSERLIPSTSSPRRSRFAAAGASTR